MKHEERWTFIEKYQGSYCPKNPRICSECNYQGYFNLINSLVMVPGRPPFLEICPECGNEIELEEGENPYFPYTKAKEQERSAEANGLSVQELINETHKRIIPEIDLKTRKVRLVNKDTGEEIKVYK